MGYIKCSECDKKGNVTWLTDNKKCQSCKKDTQTHSEKLLEKSGWESQLFGDVLDRARMFRTYLEHEMERQNKEKNTGGVYYNAPRQRMEKSKQSNNKSKFQCKGFCI